jgi:hypothetical protein
MLEMPKGFAGLRRSIVYACEPRAVWGHGRYLDNLENPLTGTPCQTSQAASLFRLEYGLDRR